MSYRALPAVRAIVKILIFENFFTSENQNDPTGHLVKGIPFRYNSSIHFVAQLKFI